MDMDRVPGNGLMGVLARPGVRGSPPLLPGGIAADGRSRERVTVCEAESSSFLANPRGLSLSVEILIRLTCRYKLL